MKLIMAPFIGLIYFLSLPFISITLIGYVIFQKLIMGIKHVLYFSWKPNECYLYGKRRVKK